MYGMAIFAEETVSMKQTSGLEEAKALIGWELSTETQNPHDIFLHSLCLPFAITICAILSTSFEDKGLHLGRCLVVQPSDGFLNRNRNFKRSVQTPRFHLISTLLIRQTRLTWHSGKGPLARNPDMSLWRRYTEIKLFWTQPVVPWAERHYT